MTHRTPLTLTVLATVFALSACEPKRATDLPPGSYEKTTRTTNEQGTTTTHTSETDVYVDADGNKTAVVQSKTTEDPKGLFNKKTTQKTTVVEEENR